MITIQKRENFLRKSFFLAALFPRTFLPFSSAFLDIEAPFFDFSANHGVYVLLC